MRLLCENVATRSSSKTDTNRPLSDLHLATIKTESLGLETRRNAKVKENAERDKR